MGPTNETLRRTGATQAVRQIADAAGNIGQPWLTQTGMLYRLEARGTISPAMAQAGERFAQLFHIATLNPLKAADPNHVRGGRRPDMPVMVETARRRIHAAVQACGGHGSPGGECLWFVVGVGVSLKSWATRDGWGGRTISAHAAQGVLITMLAVLANHLGMERHRPD